MPSHTDIIADAIRTSVRLDDDRIAIEARDHAEGVMVTINGPQDADLIGADEAVVLDDAGNGYELVDSGSNGGPEGGFYQVWAPRA